MSDRNPTSLGGPNREFPETRWSLIQGAQDRTRSREALDELCRLYWKPVYAYVRSARSGVINEAAKDLTQEFFVELLEGGLLSRYVPGLGSFRRYLKGAVQLFLRERHRQEQAQRRGGGKKLVSLDDGEVRIVDQLVERGMSSPEEAFDRQWANSLLEQSVAALQGELAAAGRASWFAVFDRYDVRSSAAEAPTYADLAREHGMKETDVANRLTWCRRRLREILQQRVADYVSFEGEVSVELAELFPRG